MTNLVDFKYKKWAKYCLVIILLSPLILYVYYILLVLFSTSWNIEIKSYEDQCLNNAVLKKYIGNRVIANEFNGCRKEEEYYKGKLRDVHSDELTFIFNIPSIALEYDVNNEKKIALINFNKCLFDSDNIIKELWYYKDYSKIYIKLDKNNKIKIDKFKISDSSGIYREDKDTKIEICKKTIEYK